MDKKIFIFTVVYAIIYAILYYILEKFNLTFLVWIKQLSLIIISLGIVIFTFIVIKNGKDNKILKFVLYFGAIIFTLVIICVDLFIGVFMLNEEEITEYEGRKMIKETREVYNTNYIKYYDYTNPFVRSEQERVFMSYDDTISESEYAGTTFYDKNGKEVRDIDGNEFIDLSILKEYGHNKEYTYEDVIQFINEVNNNFKDNINNVEIGSKGNFLFIYLTNDEKKLSFDENQKQEFQNTIDEFIKDEKTKKDSIYKINIFNEYVCIFNQKYYYLENQ